MSSSSPLSSAPEPTGLSLRPLLGGLVLLTAVAMVEKVVGLSAPRPTIVAPAALQLPPYRVEALPSMGARRGRELSHGVLRRFRLVPRGDAPALTLTLLPVRSRTATALSEETLGGKGLSLETVAAEVPSLALRERRVTDVPVEGGTGSPPPADQIALGRGPADPAGRTTRLQTCLTASGTAAVRATSLAGKGEPPRRPGESVVSPGRLLRLAGLSHSRHECLAVQLELEGPGTDPEARVGAEAAKANQARLQEGWTVVRRGLLKP